MLRVNCDRALHTGFVKQIQLCLGHTESGYRTAKKRFRAAIISEDIERRDAGAELETRSETE